MSILPHSNTTLYYRSHTELLSTNNSNHYTVLSSNKIEIRVTVSYGNLYIRWSSFVQNKLNLFTTLRN